MAAAEVFYLFGLGFFVGLSGALIPGPLLVYTINEALSKGKWVGLWVILGHAAVEACMFLLILLGLLGLINNPLFVKMITITGGIALAYMGSINLRDDRKKIGGTKSKETTHRTFFGGVIFTLFNPSFPVWWATAGSALLLEGYKVMGVLGMASVLVGHWIADFGWFIIVSMTTHKTGGTLLEKGWYNKIKKTLSLLLLVLGAYFLWVGVQVKV